MSPKLESLLLQWEEQRNAGNPISVDELCRDCPELRDQLREKISALGKMDQVLKLSEKKSTDANPDRRRTRYDDLRQGWEPIDGYRLDKQLGRGGFGEVWRATGPGGFALALKFVSLTSRLGASEITSLDVIKTVRHPNLLAISGAWQAHGFLIIAMELADKTILDRLNEATAKGEIGIPRDELMRYMQDAAKGLDYLNQPNNNLADSAKAAIQHRDIKPQNIFLMGGGVKIGDFGLLRILKKTVADHTGSMTLAYAAPEFLHGHTTRFSDQYSLAVTYCHLRGGRLPFAGHGAQVMQGHLKGKPDLSMLPESERPIVLQALAKTPTDRWPTCTEFVNALIASDDTEKLPVMAEKKRPPLRLPLDWSKTSVLSALGVVGLALVGLVLFAMTLTVTVRWIANKPTEKETVKGKGGKIYLSTLTAIEGNCLSGLGKGSITGEETESKIIVGGMAFPLGLGTHPHADGIASVKFLLKGLNAERFHSTIALNDSVTDLSQVSASKRRADSPLTFSVLGDGKGLWSSLPVQKSGQKQECNVDVSTIEVLELRVTCSKDEHGCAHAVWLDPYLIIEKSDSKPALLPPKISSDAVYLVNLQEFDVVRGPWFGKGFFNGPGTAPIGFLGKEYPNGLSMHPPPKGYASAKYKLNRKMSTFEASFGVPVPIQLVSTIYFDVNGDNRYLSSTPVKKVQVIHKIQVDIKGIDVLELKVFCPGNNSHAHAVWLDPLVRP